RVEIDADATVKYQVMRPDKETIVVSLRNATLAEGAQTKIAPEQPGPVSLVTAFAQPKTKKPEVRVVIKRAAGAKPTVTRDGEALFIDFPAGDAVAAKPPMLAAPEAPASAAAPAADSGAPHKAMAQASQAAAPASMESGNAADILQEGGLVNGKEYTGRRISLDLKEVDINDVLRLIAEVSDLNVIAGDEVTGKVTIRLVDVPWDQALDVILLTRGLGFVRVGTVLRIAPNEQLKNEEEARLQERRSHEKLEDLTVKLQPVNYANVDEVEKMVKKLLTARGVVNVDKRTNTVIIKDIPSVIDEATALVKAIDTQTPQVLIEAKVVEANLNFSRDIGTTWGFGAQPLQDPLTTGSAPQSLGGSDFLLNTTSASNNNVTFANPITNVATGLANVGAFLLDQKLNINFQLQAAETNGEGKVISSPRVVTLDNREAKILQGDSIPFQTFQNGDAQLEFIDAVLSLTVTPHITADKSIIMKVEVTRNAPDDSVKTPTGSPAIAKNEAKTETLVADGQTLVIGGIYTVDKAEQESRVPYLFKVPILGNLFREHQISDTRKELLIFLTPRVVEHAEVAG
ncbi:MAG TPA: type IV pilus secretin PilQ, partial [Myxococcota bacterium]|nr:type IV pilus secretin PilQ [Myxococcota bacterium]